MRATKALPILVLAALGGVACNPGDFNSLLDEAPVVSFSPEGASTGSLFVLPLSPPAEPGTTAAARMLVSRKDAVFLGIADFDVNGKVKLHKASESDTNILRESFVYSAATRSDGTILVGAPSYGGGVTPPGRVFSLSPTPDGAGGYSLNLKGAFQGAGRLGIAVAAGNVTGQPPGNFVVVGDNVVEVLGDDPLSSEVAKARVATTNTGFCAALTQPGSSSGGFYAFRPLAVGDLLPGGFDEIVISNNQGSVLFLQYDGTTKLDDGTVKLTCPAKTLSMPPLASFGSSLAVGDFDGDGHQDLAVGAPLDTVYVYFGPLDPLENETKPSVTIKGSSVTGFGERIASYHVPGAPAAQLLVGDRSATASGGRPGAGRVLLFNISRNYPVLTGDNAVVSLFDSNSEEGQQEFGGTNLGGLLFNTGLCVPGGGVTLVPWASTNLDVLTFFNYVGATSDPRCFALTR